MGASIVEIPSLVQHQKPVEERLVEVPQIQILESVREEIQPFYRERVKEIPKVTVNYVEKVEEVNHHVTTEGALPVPTEPTTSYGTRVGELHALAEPVATTAAFASPLNTPLIIAAASADATTQDARH